jgi:hypothetical protein
LLSRETELWWSGLSGEENGFGKEGCQSGVERGKWLGETRVI